MRSVKMHSLKMRSLKTGTLIIGSLSLVLSLICMVTSIGLMEGSPVSATILQYEADATSDICHFLHNFLPQKIVNCDKRDFAKKKRINCDKTNFTTKEHIFCR